MEDRIYALIKKTCQKEAQPSLNLSLREDLGFQSLDMLMLIGEIENEFDIAINEEQFADVLTVGDIVEKLKAEGVLEV